jgi:hypothetical protein
MNATLNLTLEGDRFLRADKLFDSILLLIDHEVLFTSLVLILIR